MSGFLGTRYRRRIANVPELYIVATPIGNLEDITLRALAVFRSVDLIAAEDTRTTRKLLSAHGISKALTSCNARSEANSAKFIISALREGKNVAYASDAGTPGLSDPGKTLVRMVRDAGFRIVPIPGASAATALLSVSGHVGKQALFEGFLSPKSGRRRKRINELLQCEIPFILFESPHRILKLLSDLADLTDKRNIVVGRELTKIYEEIVTGTAAEILALLEERESQRGEFTLLVEVEKKN